MPTRRSPGVRTKSATVPVHGAARLKLIVRDEAGRPSPFRVEWYSAGPPSDLDIRRVWSPSGSSDLGTARLELPPGRVTVLVRRGIDHDAVAFDLDPPSGETVSKEVTLRRRFDARALGWYGGENHMHVLHGRSDEPRTIADGGRQALADGLDYVQLAYGWERTFAWLSADELDRQCAAASTPEVTVGWNIEAPKAYMSEDDGGASGNLHCFGHGWTVGLRDNSRGRDFFRSGPAFRVIQEVGRQGGIVGCAHPVRFWFNKGNFVSNWASELPFDFVAGAPYTALDILNDSPLLFFESEHLWYTLLNMGYKVAGTGNTDGSLGGTTGLGRYRTYTKIDGAFSWPKLAEGMRAGRTVATSGPFVLFEADGRPPGAEFPADSRAREARVRAWSGPLPGEALRAVQLVRNGEVVRAWDLGAENAREWGTSFELRDSEFAWYCVRVLSSCRDPHSLSRWGPHVHELAVANPVYFLPAGFERPGPTPARVALSVTDAATGEPPAPAVEVSVHDEGDGAGEIERLELPSSGEAALTVPATASLVVTAPGYGAEKRCLYMDCPELFEYCRTVGTVWPSFFSPETYEELRRRLSRLKLAVALRRDGT